MNTLARVHDLSGAGQLSAPDAPGQKRAARVAFLAGGGERAVLVAGPRTFRQASVCGRSTAAAADRRCGSLCDEAVIELSYRHDRHEAAAFLPRGAGPRVRAFSSEIQSWHGVRGRLQDERYPRFFLRKNRHPSSRHDGLLHRASHRTGHADHASGSLDWSIKVPAQAGQIPAGC